MTVRNTLLIALLTCAPALVHAQGGPIVPPPPPCTLVSSPGSGVVCNQKGAISTPNTTRQVTSAGLSFEQCRDQAGQLSSSYKSFAYNAAAQRCTVFVTSLAQQGFRADAQGMCPITLRPLGNSQPFAAIF